MLSSDAPLEIWQLSTADLDSSNANEFVPPYPKLLIPTTGGIDSRTSSETSVMGSAGSNGSIDVGIYQCSN